MIRIIKKALINFNLKNTDLNYSNRGWAGPACGGDGLNSLNGVQCSLPGGAFYAFPNIKETGMNGEEFTKKCLHEAGVAIVPGTSFGNFATDYVRFSFAASSENISKAIEKIDKILK